MKIAIDCPMCSTATLPQEKMILFIDDIDFPVKLWRYKCGQCEWIWADEKQREHNSREHKKAYRKRNSRFWE